jgi:hypothetical protein
VPLGSQGPKWQRLMMELPPQRFPWEITKGWVHKSVRNRVESHYLFTFFDGFWDSAYEQRRRIEPPLQLPYQVNLWDCMRVDRIRSAHCLSSAIVSCSSTRLPFQYRQMLSTVINAHSRFKSNQCPSFSPFTSVPLFRSFLVPYQETQRPPRFPLLTLPNKRQTLCGRAFVVPPPHLLKLICPSSPFIYPHLASCHSHSSMRAHNALTAICRALDHQRQRESSYPPDPSSISTQRSLLSSSWKHRPFDGAGDQHQQ